MKLNEYQNQAVSTAKSNIKNDEAYLALGLVGEAGEVAEKIKKSIRDGVLDVEGLQKELGDVLWYISILGLRFGFDLEGIAKMNLHKLNDRKNRNKLGGSGDDR